MPKLKHFKDLPITTTTHGVGKKRVLLSNDETTTAITQIAVTKFKAGEEVESHIHPTMEEYYQFRKGHAIMIISGEEFICNEDDFVVVPAAAPHFLRAITDLEILTIGCATE